ncbi:hypothetical protein PoB_005895500 [Plakobranchus ocellatus]|uniref:Uncharacterized protein n=1 Tax=Plakobranchus ocellatus TaxID=259542 RepID=A0AAV4CKP6_9GAST|nr:hypothetical protein PoB_005895500 [Plakobranchus ocellatus]
MYFGEHDGCTEATVEGMNDGYIQNDLMPFGEYDGALRLQLKALARPGIASGLKHSFRTQVVLAPSNPHSAVRKGLVKKQQRYRIINACIRDTNATLSIMCVCVCVVDSVSALRSAGTFLTQVRAPLLTPWLDGGPQSLKSPCCGLAIYMKPNPSIHAIVYKSRQKVSELLQGGGSTVKPSRCDTQKEINDLRRTPSRRHKSGRQSVPFRWTC